jgi:hypothetical protein
MSLHAPTSEFGYAAVGAAEADAMLAFLSRLHPATGSEALRALREAFPLVSLAARVTAMSNYAAKAD